MEEWCKNGKPTGKGNMIRYAWWQGWLLQTRILWTTAARARRINFRIVFIRILQQGGVESILEASHNGRNFGWITIVATVTTAPKSNDTIITETMSGEFVDSISNIEFHNDNNDDFDDIDSGEKEKQE